MELPDAGVYQKDGNLVRAITESRPSPGLARAPGAPYIYLFTKAHLREMMSAAAKWRKWDTQKEAWVAAHPPMWAVDALLARKHYPSVPYLRAITATPILSLDGSINMTPGYDEKSEVMYLPTRKYPDISDNPSYSAVEEAKERLLDLVVDFPFEDEAHKAAWLAAVLTPLARFNFIGPAPLFLIDANVRGSGKSLLAKVASRIATGNDPAIMVNADGEEMRKRITALVISGDLSILIDNVSGTLGNEGLEGVLLTGSTWRDRILGHNEMVRGELLATWTATANNCSLTPDMTRRCCHIRFNSKEENPEDRSGFRHPELYRLVCKEQPVFTAAALTILAGYYAAGKPKTGLPTWGSFEGWSSIVREAVVWAGLPDPGETKITLRESADMERDALADLLDEWEKIDPEGAGMTVAEVLRMIDCDNPLEPKHTALADALSAFCPPKGGKLSANAIGRKLNKHRHRIVNGKAFDRKPERTKAGIAWVVVRTIR